jgi:hypothetical protein
MVEVAGMWEQREVAGGDAKMKNTELTDFNDSRRAKMKNANDDRCC